MNAGTTGRVVEAVALMVKQPRTVGELASAMGAATHQAGRYVKLLHADGLLYVCGWRLRATKPSAVYAWQPAPFERADVPYEPKRVANPRHQLMQASEYA